MKWKKNFFTNQDIFQYTIQYEGKSFSGPWERKSNLPQFSCIFKNLFKYVVIIFFESDIQHYISSQRLTSKIFLRLVLSNPKICALVPLTA